MGQVTEAAAASSAGALQRGKANAGTPDSDVTTCPTCKGKGKVDGGTCPDCGGTGRVSQVKEGRRHPPPNLRVSDSPEDAQPEHECGTCLMYDGGLCWGYGNFPVDGEWVCDSWKLDPSWKQQDGLQDLRDAIAQPEDPMGTTAPAAPVQEAESSVCSVCLTAECGVEGPGRLREADLSTKQRKGLGKSSFAVPEKAPESGSYPIPDESHARNALARVAQHGTPAEQAQVKRAVKRKFPNIDVGTAKESESPEQTVLRLANTLQLEHLLRESKPQVLNSTYSTPTRVTTSTGQEGYKVVLIREGRGNAEDDNWYTVDAVREMCESGVAEGMQAYANHPSLDEEESRPERDVRQLVGSYHDVTFAESNGVARAEAVFVPLTTDEAHPTYGWVVTLAEAAANSRGPQPLAGISLYGLSAGDYGDRPDGSEGRLVTLIRPTSGDVVTNAGAGGEFIRQMMESARRLRAGASTTQKGAHPMQVGEFKSKFAEATKRLREADSDEARNEAQKELDTLSETEIDAPARTPDSVEALTEAAPKLVEKIRESAKAETADAEGDLKAQLEAAHSQLREAQGLLSGIADTSKIADVLKECKVAEGERKWFMDQARARGLREAEDVRDYVQTEMEHREAMASAMLDKMRESLGGDTTDIEGVFARMPVPVATDGGVDVLREAGVPTKDAA